MTHPPSSTPRVAQPPSAVSSLPSADCRLPSSSPLPSADCPLPSAPAPFPPASVTCSDALTFLRTLPPSSAHALVTDPPAGISFMGKAWDSDKGGRDKWIAWMQEIAAEALRVLKPGAHALVWALPRTSHWTATAWENAGFEVRDRIGHIFGQGFPKSLDASKALDKALGAERETLGVNPNREGRHYTGNNEGWQRPWQQEPSAAAHHVSAPSTSAACQWDGWGTALKPAVEDWWLLRKPLAERNVARNLLTWGCGAININACRVGVEAIPVSRHNKTLGGNGKYGGGVAMATGGATGRFPAHLTHDGSEEALAVFPIVHGPGNKKPCEKHYACRVFGWGLGAPSGSWGTAYKGDGSAARFFYCAKASKAERDAGCQAMANPKRGEVYGGGISSSTRCVPGLHTPEGVAKRPVHQHGHPTVKPLALMRWLCRLICPPGGVLIDPFAGSGTTLVAAILEGFQPLGCDADPDSVAIAQARIQWAVEQASKPRQLPLPTAEL